MRTKPIPKKRVEVQIIDNFLPKQEFESLSKFVMKNQEAIWQYIPDIEGVGYTGTIKDYKDRNQKLFYMVHKLFDDHLGSRSHLMDLPIFSQLLNKLGITKLIRYKINFYPNTEKVYEHEYHIDYPFNHMGAVFYLNTCDGYTKLKDGTKVESIANRIFIFDASKEHCSTTTSNVAARFNINVNYYNDGRGLD